jgi:hypothetical protein
MVGFSRLHQAFLWEWALHTEVLAHRLSYSVCAWASPVLVLQGLLQGCCCRPRIVQTCAELVVLCRCGQALLHVRNRAPCVPAAVLEPGAVPEAVAAAGRGHAQHALQGRQRRLPWLPGAHEPFMTNGHAKISFSMMGGCKDLILDDGRRPHAICPSRTPSSSAMLPGVPAPCSGCVSSDRPLLCKSESAEASCNPSAQRTASAAGSAHAKGKVDVPLMELLRGVISCSSA